MSSNGNSEAKRQRWMKRVTDLNVRQHLQATADVDGVEQEGGKVADGDRSCRDEGSAWRIGSGYRIVCQGMGRGAGIETLPEGYDAATVGLRGIEGLDQQSASNLTGRITHRSPTSLVP